MAKRPIRTAAIETAHAAAVVGDAVDTYNQIGKHLLEMVVGYRALGEVEVHFRIGKLPLFVVAFPLPK